MRRIVIKILLAIPVLFSLLVAVYLVFFDGYKDVTAGRVHREANEFFMDTEDIDEARIYLIQGEGKSDGTFPIRPYGRDEPTYGTLLLTGTELREFLRTWEYQEVSLLGQAMCHGPVYGFRLYRKGKLLRETSMCWSCSNFYVNPYPGGATFYGFNAKSKEAQALLAFCDKRLPYQKR